MARTGLTHCQDNVTHCLWSGFSISVHCHKLMPVLMTLDDLNLLQTTSVDAYRLLPLVCGHMAPIYLTPEVAIALCD